MPAIARHRLLVIYVAILNGSIAAEHLALAVLPEELRDDGQQREWEGEALAVNQISLLCILNETVVLYLAAV